MSFNSDSINPADHLPYAIRQSRTYAKMEGVPVADSEAYADACIGLCQAARGFDSSRGFKYITYAGACIRVAMIGGYNLRKRGWVGGEKSAGMRQTENGLHSLCDATESAEQQLEREDQLAKLETAITQLPADLQRVIRLRMDGLLLREIAEQMGRTKQRISQIELQAHAELRKMLE